MKKLIALAVIFSVLLAAGSVFAQDYKATAEALEYQLQIMQLQATIDALQGGSGSGTSSGGSSDGMWNWNSQNSPYVPTPTPFGGSTNYPGTTVTTANFPSQVRPPAPTGPAPTWKKPADRYSTEIYVGDAGQYLTISEAVKHLPAHAGEVTIYLVSDTEEPQAGISIPIDKKITSFRIASDRTNRKPPDTKTKRTIYPKDRSVWFFCNGIPLIVDETIVFAPSTMIMGGLCTYQGHNVEAPKSTIIMNGTAYWVYAGGQSDREGHSSTVDDALVIVNGKVDRVYAGGRAIWGETIVHNATVIVNGTASEVYCSGFAQNASAKTTVGRADMKVYGWYNKYGLGLGNGTVMLLNPNGCY